MNIYERYLARVYAAITKHIYGISSNYASGWTTGDVDYY